MSREKLIEVQQMLREKRFDEARALLATIEHPRVRAWEAQLNAISPPKSSAEPQRSPPNEPKANGETIVSVKIVCPRCGRRTRQAIDLQDDATMCQCSRCGLSFSSRVERIRSQRSWPDRESNRRRFWIHTIHPVTHRADLIEFEARLDAGDLGLKAKDMAAFAYLGADPVLVQNLSNGRHLVLEQPGPDGEGSDAGAAAWWLSFSAFVFVIVVALWLALQLNR